MLKVTGNNKVANNTSNVNEENAVKSNELKPVQFYGTVNGKEYAKIILMKQSLPYYSSSSNLRVEDAEALGLEPVAMVNVDTFETEFGTNRKGGKYVKKSAHQFAFEAVYDKIFNEIGVGKDESEGIDDSDLMSWSDAKKHPAYNTAVQKVASANGGEFTAKSPNHRAQVIALLMQGDVQVPEVVEKPSKDELKAQLAELQAQFQSLAQSLT